MEQDRVFAACAAFHGHACGGLAIGYRASLYAKELLSFHTRASDAELVCIAETDGCAIDAVQFILGCTAGKGNLIVRPRGKQAFTFYDRSSGNGVRIMLKPIGNLSREEKQQRLLTAEASELFITMPPREPMPKKAPAFRSLACARCGELTAEPYLRIRNGQTVCLDCMEEER